MNNYIDEYTWKCFLGPMAKKFYAENNKYYWQVGAKHHFATDKTLNFEDIKNLDGYSFYYMTPENCDLLKKYYKISRSKGISTKIDLTKLDLSGGDYKKVRQSINKNKNKNFELLDNYKNIDDVKKMINEWSEILAQKYFQDHSGKNFYFYKNNFHQNCINVFAYEGDDLIGFATASPCKNSSYIIGKALCNRHSGLSEFMDYQLYIKCLNKGIEVIDLGQTSGGLSFYKNKFPGASTYTYYNGKIYDSL